jgi:putative DNA primase/helicase
MVGAALSGIAKRIRVLRLPELPDQGDVVDWVAAGGTAERLRQLAEQAPEWLPPAADAHPDPAKKAAADAREQKLIDELARLPTLDYDKQRKQAARDLGVRNSSLDKEVEGRRAELAAEAEPTPLYPHWVVEPWPVPVDGNALIRDIMRRVQRHVVLTQDQVLTATLWILMAWAHAGAAIYSPILMATSAEANSGKTTLLNVIGFLAPRSLSSVGITEATLFRSIEKWGPTIFVDEADTILVNNEPLRAVINSGWTRGSGVLRCDGVKTPHLFPTFCPKVIGMKGRCLPDTTISRCIIIELKRKKPSDSVDHFHYLDDAELANLRRQALRWTMDNVATLETAIPELPAGFDNRLGDNWRLMVAIADLAGVEWPDRARQAATAIARVADADMSVGVKLLADIRDIFAGKAVYRMPSAELVEALVEIERHPWADIKGGKPITANGLARLLAGFAIASGNMRVGVDRVAKGYQVAQFQDAFERYL